GVTREEAGLLERGAVVLHVDAVERTGDAETQSAGLARVAATRDAGDDVVRALEVQHLERVVDQLLVQLVREVVLERTAVDRDASRAGDQTHAGDGLLATTDGCAGDVQHRTGSRLGRCGLRAGGRVVLRGFGGFDVS